MPIEFITSLSNSLLTFGQDCRLPSDLFKSPDDLLIPVYKAIKCIRYSHIRAELLYEFLGSAKVVSWHPWK